MWDAAAVLAALVCLGTTVVMTWLAARASRTNAPNQPGSVEAAEDGREFPVTDHGQDWLVAWFRPPDPPPATPHGAAAVCVSGDRVVLVSVDGRSWGLPGGRPAPGESWADTLRREVREEACATVTGCELLGFSRGVCVRGPQAGTVQVRSMWRAEVRLEPWHPRFETNHRKLARPEDALHALAAGEQAMAPIYRRMFMEAGLGGSLHRMVGSESAERAMPPQQARARVDRVIEVRELTKRYGSTVAVQGLSFRVEPGRVTGFLGPNGAGKSTTIRLILGLDRPDAGTATINGQEYRSYRHPLFEVGALLEAKATHPGRTAINHLRWLAQTHGISRARVAAVLESTGLTSAAARRVGGYSLGMSQRLGLAAALLGDPPVLLLDEPMNGLDPAGMTWLRELLTSLAAEGRTVLVSSHQMSEMQQIADHLIIIGRGRLVSDTTVAGLLSSASRVSVSTPQPRELAALLEEMSAEVHRDGDRSLSVAGIDATDIGRLAAAHDITIHELFTKSASLEATFLELTRDDVDFRGSNR